MPTHQLHDTEHINDFHTSIKKKSALLCITPSRLMIIVFNAQNALIRHHFGSCILPILVAFIFCGCGGLKDIQESAWIPIQDLQKQQET